MSIPKNLSSITLNFEDMDKDVVERELNTKLLPRSMSCHVIMNLTQVKPSFLLFRKTGEIKKVFEKYREHSDKVIKESTILVGSRPAKFIARIFLKIAKPSCPTIIQIVE